MKVVTFNPWKKVVVKSIVNADDPILREYATLLEQAGDYFIGITEPESLDDLVEKQFEEINIVALDKLSFDDILEVFKKEIINEELIEIFEELY